MAENAALKVVLAAARIAVRTWLEPGRVGHGQAIELLGRALIAFDEWREGGGSG